MHVVGDSSMTLLTTVGSAFEATVLVARLGAEGFLARTRGATDGPYPLPRPVDALVLVTEVDDVRQLLLADDLQARRDDRL